MRIDRIGQSKIKIGEIIDNLYIHDVDIPARRVELTLFKPIIEFKLGDRVTGYVKNILKNYAFVNIGCEVDAFLHKTQLEFGL